MPDADTRSANDTAAGTAIYIKPLLHIYDLALGFNRPGPWKCPTSKLLEFYNQHVSGNHLDVGVGIFSNAQDNLADLEQGLSTHFAEYETQMAGHVALFMGRK